MIILRRHLKQSGTCTKNAIYITRSAYYYSHRNRMTVIVLNT